MVRRWLARLSVPIVASVGLVACHFIADLELAPPRADAGQDGATDDAAPTEAGTTLYCNTIAPTDERGAVLFCNDFDRGALGPKLGFEGVQLPLSGGTVTVDQDASSSPPSSMVVRIVPDPGKPLALATQTFSVPLDKLSLDVDVSVATPDASTESAVTLFGVLFGGDRVVVVGIHNGQTTISYLDNLKDINVSETAAHGYMFGGVLAPGVPFNPISLRFRRGKPPCGESITRYIGPDAGLDPDAGDAGDDAAASPLPSDAIHVAVYVSQIPVRCAVLPADVPVGATSQLLIGGFVAHPKERYEWRFDNIVARALP